MLRSQQYIAQGQPQLYQKLILDPLELLAFELQSKDINSKRQSIQNIQVIALTMDEKEIVNSLFPFLMKVMIEQNNKELKLSIMKSFKNILPLLSKQKSYLKLLQILIDVSIVFEQIEIRSQALSILNELLFDQNVLDFQKLKPQFKALIMTQIKQITEPSTAKNAKQLSFHLIKYFFHKSKEVEENQTLQIIKFIKKFFIQTSASNDFSNIRIFAQNLHLLVEKWPKNLSFELESLIILFTGFQRLQKNLNKENPIEQVQEPQNSKQQCLIKQDLLLLPKQVKLQVRCSAIPALIAYGKYFDLHKSHLILQKLLKDQNPHTKVGFIKKSKQVFQTFKNLDLSALLAIFKNFSQQSHDIKKAIIEVIDDIELDQTIRNELIIKNCKNTIDLKNILIQSLVKSKKSEAVGQILTESDYDFKVKIFMKLPDILLHKNESYADIIDSLLSEPKKNFRSKLNIIINLITRIEENVSKLKQNNKVSNIGQTFDISYLIRTLVKYFGDRVAVIRVNVAKLYALIMNYFKMDFSVLSESLKESYYGENKGWFERQNVLIMINEYLTVRSQDKIQSQNRIGLKQQNPQLYNFIDKILRNASSGIVTKTKSNEFQKLTIKNISILASQILSRYPIQQL